MRLMILSELFDLVLIEYLLIGSRFMEKLGKQLNKSLNSHGINFKDDQLS